MRIDVSQNETILEALRRGEVVTPARAFELCGSYACHSRIAELRERGHDIRCTVRRKNGRKFGEYSLVKTDPFA